MRFRVSDIDNAAEPMVDVNAPIPDEDLQHIIKAKHALSSQFQFPLAFGHDLQEIVVLHTVIRPYLMLEAYSRLPMRSFYSQKIDLAPKGISRLERPYEEAEYPAWYRVWTSQARRYLAVTKRRGKPEIVKHNSWGVWSLTVWEDGSQADQEPSYVPFGEIYLNTTHLGKDGFVAFHPTLPLVVASGDIEAVCWNFKSQSKSPSVS